MSNYLLLLLILACPLMMIFMMRGMHGGRGDADGGRGHGNQITGGDPPPQDSLASLEELRRQRDALEREIEERESNGEVEEHSPLGGAAR